tara:strand:+ start:424 stop:1482 length:1059 start_codon:yes stop_codon:yes gene_type:complete
MEDIKLLVEEFTSNSRISKSVSQQIDSKHEEIISKADKNKKAFSYSDFRNWEAQNDMGLKYPMTFLSKIFLGINNLFLLNNFSSIIKKRFNHFFEYSSMLDDIQVIKSLGGELYLEENPQNKTPGAGNFPLVEGYSVTKRWLRYLYIFIQMKERGIINNNSVWVDIGSYYGGLQGIIKKYFPETKIILVDFNHQLMRSYIYLKNLYPQSNHILPNQLKKIDSINDLPKGSIVYVEVEDFKLLNKFKVDLVSNFFSLGEMKEETFKGYLYSSLIKNAKYNYFINRMFSSPFFDKTYDDNLNILDYNFSNNDAIHFDQFPMGNYQINNRQLHNRTFFRNNSSQYFEVILRNKLS